MTFLGRRTNSGANRDFSANAPVSTNVRAGAVAISAEQAEQTQRENAAIARGLRSQNPEVLDRLIELYQHRLIRYLLFLTGRREVAEDLFQATWMRVLMRGAQYNGQPRFDTSLST